MSSGKTRLVILDRDGVINEDSPDYVKSVQEWRPIPGSLEAIVRLNRAGYRVAIATNQSGIGRGLFSLETLAAIHARLHAELAALGGEIAQIEFAPEAPEHATPMRKPAPGMLLKLAADLDADLAETAFVGDSVRDILAARAAGARPILVLTGNGERTRMKAEAAGVALYPDLASFVEAWLQR